MVKIRWTFSAIVSTAIGGLSRALLVLLVHIAGASAATFAVNSTIDAVDANPGDGKCETAPGNGVCTLRAAIQETNASPGPNEIILPPGTYTLTIPGRFEGIGVFHSAMGDLDITNDLTITGDGATTTIIDANGIDRAFHVDPLATGITVTISGVTIQHGAALGIPFLATGNGGGILIGGGSLTLIDSVLNGNSTPQDGGGIFNQGGTVSLIRTSVIGNSAGGSGGGIANGDTGIVNMTDSTVGSNFATQNGGGVFSGYFDISNSTKVFITNSTFSDNRTSGFGGGIHGNRGPITLTNVTVSGNTSAASGGGIFVGGSSTLVNNATIAFNTTGEFGSGIEVEGGPVTMSNTIIADNIGDADCSATVIVTSGGHNLIQNASGCDISGDSSGNIIGQDPKLGLLADNGGLTQTHALISGSPAIDAGSPAAPGSGGFACALSDQRGYLRPRGPVCDIGAFERVSELSVTGILPRLGANTAPVTAFIAGNGFLAGASARLKRTGQTDVVGTPINIDQGGSAIATAFDLSGKAAGSWDVVITNPGGSTATLPAAFTVDQQAPAPEPWVNLIGPDKVRPNGTGIFTIAFGNTGSSDALAVPLMLSIPNGFTGSFLFELMPPPAQPNQAAIDWTQVAITTATPSPGMLNFNLLIPIIPAGYSGALPLQLKAFSAPEGATFSIFVSLGTPYFGPSLDPSVVSGFVVGAQAYAQRNLGKTISATLVPQMSQFVSTILQSEVQDGRNALIQTFGQTQGIYVLPHLVIDAAATFSQ